MKAQSIPRSLHRLFPKLKTIENSDKSIVVSVSSKDCALGKKLESSECALAKAVKRQYKADGAVIAMHNSYIIRGTHAIRFHTSEAVKREIVSFDRHNDFAPGDYKLSPVSPSARRGYRPDPRKRSGKEHRIVHKKTVRVRETA